MFRDSVLFPRKQNFCLVPSKSNDVKPNLNLTISLATTAICLLANHQSATATNLQVNLAPSNSAQNYSFSNLGFEQATVDSHADCQYQHHCGSGWLSRLLGLLPKSFQTQMAGWSQGWGQAEHQQQEWHRGVGGSSTPDLTPLYLSQGQSTSPKEFSSVNINSINIKSISSPDLPPLLLATKPSQQLQTYTVKAGDTIAQIAREHQVSRDEIVRLNHIANSNIIFVNQQLRIPVTNRENTVASIADSRPVSSPIKTSLRSTVSSSRVARNADRAIASNNSASDLQQERLARLNADLNRMRAENRARQNKPTSDLFSQPNPNSGQSKSKIRSGSRQNLAAKTDNLVSSVRPEAQRDGDSISTTAVSLQLPPLPPSEEYLPKAFDGYTWPAQGVLTSGYGWRWGRLHKGIDIAGPVGTPIVAAASGEVIDAGWNSGGYGNLVKLRHLDGSVTLYAHNHRILVSEGQTVTQGDLIAEMGNTGFSTGSHLHFEIHSREQGIVNPLALLD